MTFFNHLSKCRGEGVAAFLEQNRNQRGTYFRKGRIFSFSLAINYRSLMLKLEMCIAQAHQPIKKCRFCMRACAADQAYRGLKCHIDGCSFVQTLRDRAMSIIIATTTENAEQIAALMPEGSEFEPSVSELWFKMRQCRKSTLSNPMRLRSASN